MYLEEIYMILLPWKFFCVDHKSGFVPSQFPCMI